MRLPGKKKWIIRRDRAAAMVRILVAQKRAEIIKIIGPKLGGSFTTLKNHAN